MNMDRFMVIAIELEDKSKKDEYCWHDRRCFYSLFAKLRLFLEPTKRNLIFLLDIMLFCRSHLSIFIVNLEFGRKKILVMDINDSVDYVILNNITYHEIVQCAFLEDYYVKRIFLFLLLFIIIVFFDFIFHLSNFLRVNLDFFVHDSIRLSLCQFCLVYRNINFPFFA